MKSDEAFCVVYGGIIGLMIAIVISLIVGQIIIRHMQNDIERDMKLKYECYQNNSAEGNVTK